MDFTAWWTLLKQYGPIIGLSIGFVIWQAHQINKLLDRNAAIYEAEIKRLADVQERLLTHLIGPQPSSASSPTVKELKDGILSEGKPKPRKEGS